jgi:hypothetical protein
MLTKFWSVNLKEGDHSEYLGLDGNIMIELAPKFTSHRCEIYAHDKAYLFPYYYLRDKAAGA